MSAGNGASGGIIAPVRVDRLHLLDGLRGIAAIAVVLLHYYHFYQVWPTYELAPDWRTSEPGWRFLTIGYVYGIFAVNLFWMISGFVFSHGYLGSDATTREFIVNRFARLYPLHLLTLLMVAGLQLASQALYGHMPLYGQNDLWHFLLNLFGVSAWGFETGPSFNAPIWSVSVEIVIYAVFWLSRHRLRRWGLLGPALLVSIAGAFLVANGQSLFVACGYYFFIGTGVAMLHRDQSRSGWTIAALALAGAIGLGSGNAALAVAIGLPGLGGAAMLGLASAELRASNRLRQVCAVVGDNTYGVYLWHVPLQLLLILLLRPYYDIMALASNWWFLIAYLVAVNTIARISFVRFERPARDWLRRRLSAQRDVLALAQA